MIRQLAPTVAAEIETIIKGADVVVAGLLTVDVCRLLLEHRPGPALAVLHACPALPSSSFQSAMIDVRMPAALNKFSTQLLSKIVWWLMSDIDIIERKKRGLAAVPTLPPGTTKTAASACTCGARR